MKETKLVDATGLLEALFEKKNRPCVAWLRAQKAAGEIPFIKMGRLVFYDVEKVREKLFPK